MGERERIPVWLKELPLAPVYYPTETEFSDPIAYISKIENEASQYGICKIVPPVPKPSKKQVFKNLNKSMMDIQDVSVAGVHGSSASSISRSMSTVPAGCPSYGVDEAKAYPLNPTYRGNTENGVATFTTRLQQIGWNPKKPKSSMQFLVQKPVWQTGENYTLDQFEAKAKAFYRSRLGTFREVPPLIIEKMFWKAASDRPIFVEYANDIPGTAFGEPNPVWKCFYPTSRREGGKVSNGGFTNNRISFQEHCNSEETDIYSFSNRTSELCQATDNENIDFCIHSNPNPERKVEHLPKGNKRRLHDDNCIALRNIEDTAWNMRIVARSPGSLIRYMPDEVPGVTSPMVYIGMLFSWFAWHVEDHELHSLNYLHMGFPKTWYAVPGYAATSLEDLIRVEGYGDHLSPLAAFGILGEKTTVMSPEVLVEAGIPCCRLVQNPGEFVVTFPRAYHLGFSHGFNCGEAANFATPAWLKVAKKAAIRRAAMNHLPMLSHQQLLYMSTFAFPPRISLSPPDKTEPLSLMSKNNCEAELAVKKCFVDDMLNNNHLLAILLEKKSTRNAVLWDSAHISGSSSSGFPSLETCRFSPPSMAVGSEVFPTVLSTKRISMVYKKRRLCAPVISQEKVETVANSEKASSCADVQFTQRDEKGNVYADMDVSVCETRCLPLEGESLSQDIAQLSSGSLACVACGILGFPCMAIIQLTSEAGRKLLSADNQASKQRFQRHEAVRGRESYFVQCDPATSGHNIQAEIYATGRNKFVIRRRGKVSESEFVPCEENRSQKDDSSVVQTLKFTIKRPLSVSKEDKSVLRCSAEKSAEVDFCHSNDSSCKEQGGHDEHSDKVTLSDTSDKNRTVKELFNGMESVSKISMEASRTQNEGKSFCPSGRETPTQVTRTCQHASEPTALDLLAATYHDESESDGTVDTSESKKFQMLSTDSMGGSINNCDSLVMYSEESQEEKGFLGHNSPKLLALTAGTDEPHDAQFNKDLCVKEDHASSEDCPQKKQVCSNKDITGVCADQDVSCFESSPFPSTVSGKHVKDTVIHHKDFSDKDKKQMDVSLNMSSKTDYDCHPEYPQVSISSAEVLGEMSSLEKFPTVENKDSFQMIGAAKDTSICCSSSQLTKDTTKEAGNIISVPGCGPLHGTIDNQVPNQFTESGRASSLVPCKGFMRPHVFCLEHAMEVEEQLSSLGGAQLMLICHAEYPKIEERAKIMAKELACDYSWKNIPLKDATEGDLQLIQLAIEEQTDAELGTEWTSQLGVSLRHSVQLSRSPLCSKNMLQNKVLDSLFQDSFNNGHVHRTSGSTDLSDLKWLSKSKRGKRTCKHFVRDEHVYKDTRTHVIEDLTQDNDTLPDCAVPNELHQPDLKSNAQCESVKRPRGRPRKVKINDDDTRSVSEKSNTTKILNDNIFSSLESAPRPRITKTFYRKRRRDMGIVSDSKGPKHNGKFLTAATEHLSHDLVLTELPSSCSGENNSLTNKRNADVSDNNQNTLDSLVVPKMEHCDQLTDLEEKITAPLFQDKTLEDAGNQVKVHNSNEHSLRNYLPPETSGHFQISGSETKKTQIHKPSKESVHFDKDFSESRTTPHAPYKTYKRESGLDESIQLRARSRSRFNSPMSVSSHKPSAEENICEREENYLSTKFEVCSSKNKICDMPSGPTTRLRSRTTVGPSTSTDRNTKKMGVKQNVVRKKKKAKHFGKDDENEDLYDCDIEGCSMSFRTKQELGIHKQNTCTFKGCSKWFSSHKYLMQHRRVHLDDRPFSCSWTGCKMTFKWAWAKTEHMRVHTGERPYVCPLASCGKTFRFVSDFSRHKRKTGHK